MNLGIDIDGTINNMSELLRELALKFNIENGLPTQNIPNDVYELDKAYGWNKRLNKKFWDNYYVHAMETAKLKIAAVQSIRNLKEKGVNIFIITARNEQYRNITEKWLNKFSIPYNKLIMDAEDKASICKELDIDTMVEDKAETCMQVAKFIPVICMYETYNAFLEGSSCSDRNIQMVHNWAEAFLILNRLIKKEKKAS